MLSDFFIKRPKFAFAIAAIIVLAGLVALDNLPMAKFPPIVPPQVQVSTNYPGARAETIMKTIIEPLETQINGVQDMIYMSSIANNEGTAEITVTFAVGSNPNLNTVNTQNRITRALPELPDEVRLEGVIVREVSSLLLMFINLESTSEKYDALYLNNFMALHIQDPIQRIPGVGEAMIFGQQSYAMRVWLNPDKLASLGVTTNDVVKAIEGQNLVVAAGEIGSAPISSEQQMKYIIKTMGRLSTVEEFGNIIIKEKLNGAKILLSNVAKIELGSESYGTVAYHNESPTSAMGIYLLPGANALEVAKAVENKIKQLSKTFPKNIKAIIPYNTTMFVDSSINQVVTTLIIAVLLVLLVVFLFLQDIKATFIPFVAIPVSLLGSCMALKLLNYSINTITLFGMILAIGLVVDDAIVVVENTFRIMDEEGRTPKEAALKSMKQISGPIIATTFVLFAVFGPVAFIPGISGQLYRQFAVTILTTVFFSAFNALTLSPALCATILKAEKKQKNKFFIWFNKYFDLLANKYNKLVGFLIRKIVVAVVIFLVIILAAVYLLNTVPKGFIPPEDQGAFMMNVQLPDGAALPRTDVITDQVYNILKDTAGIDSVIRVVGFSGLAQISSSNSSFVVAILKNWSERKADKLHAAEIISRVNNKFKAILGAEVVAFNLPPIIGLGTGRGFQYELQLEEGTGKTLRDLNEVKKALIYESKKYPEIGMLYSIYQADSPQIYVDIDRDKAKKLGVEIPNILNTMQAFLGGTYVNEFNKFNKVYQVIVQADEKFRRNINSINKLYVRNKKGGMIPLGTLIKITPMLGPVTINHYNMLTSLSIYGQSARGYSSAQAISAMEKLSKKTLPGGMTYSWTATAYQQILAGNKTVYIFIFGIVIIYLFLIALYESYMFGFAVLFSIPVAVLGALAATSLCSLNNNIYAQIGIVLLFGLACKTAILIIEFAKKRREEGDSVIGSAAFAAKLRFRAVVMTSLAFILGVLPLALSTGAGASGSHSIGITVVGGMVLTLLIGVVLMPSYFVMIQKIIGLKFKKKK
ncbi:MAG: multidrug efflux RND transporter permease subunit [bacterium]|nr:multidrug efflux RND transporter permease subunit [bacterium]